MSQQLPDIQASAPDTTVGLNQVGVTGVEKLVKIAREEKRPIVLMGEFDVFVDLPSWRKGADMSRNMEVINEILEETTDDISFRPEDVCGAAAERLLAKHEYTTKAEIEMEATFVERNETPESGKANQSTVDVIASATATEDQVLEEIGVRVTGMTVCPCSQGMSEARARRVMEDLSIDRETIDSFLEQVPQPGHSQRGHATLSIKSDDVTGIELDDLIEICRNGMSGPIYNMAKRPDEDYMTFESHSDAKFVEDCVRSIATSVVEEFEHLDDSSIVTIKQTNEESIHQHNAHAECVSTMKNLRESVQE